MENNLNSMPNIQSCDSNNLIAQSEPSGMETDLSTQQHVSDSGIGTGTGASTPVLSNVQVVVNNANVSNSPLQVVLNTGNTATGLHSGNQNASVLSLHAGQTSGFQTQSPIVHVQNPISLSHVVTQSSMIHSSNKSTASLGVGAGANPSLTQTTPIQHGSISSPQQTPQPTLATHLSSIPQSKPSTDYLTQILTKPRLQELVREIDGTEQLDEEVEELMLQLADDFVETVVNAACLLAKHRHGATPSTPTPSTPSSDLRHPKTLDVKDIQLYLERNWNMWIPGFGTDELRPYKRAPVTDAHRQRMALIRKTIKKY